MQEKPFRAWLKDKRGLQKNTISSRVSNCRRVERELDVDLDSEWENDELKELIERFDEQTPVSIDGDASEGTATLKSAIRLYGDFRHAQDDRDSAADRERWNLYLEDVRRYVERGLMDSEEVDPKLRTERQLQEARRAVLAGHENCLDLVVKAFSTFLIDPFSKMGLRNWCQEQPEEARQALRAIWTEDEDLSTADRIRAFTARIPRSLPSGKQPPTAGTGTRLRWISVLLMACGARSYPPYKVSEFSKAYESTGHPGPDPSGDEASHYEHALGFLEVLMKKAREAGMGRPADRLEAQSVVWAVAGGRGAAPEPADDRPCWFVGASFGEGTGDQTDRFVREGIWEHGGAKSDLFLDQVKSIEPGDRIAIKATYLKKHGLPFDNQGELASTMAIKATGTVTRNAGDGRRLFVEWELVDPHREWFFFTFIPRVWKVSRETANLPWAAEALIDFAFNGATQDYDLFLRDWYPERYEEQQSSAPGAREHARLSDTDIGPLVEELLYDEADLRTIARLLDDKRQVIFQGPPGTGKTYAARKLACHLAGSDQRVTLVQFHPSYAYEDFVQGYRPTLTEEGQAGFALRDGPLVQTARRAEDEPASPHFLIIDEINRGNLAKVFGELYFLLEYRDENMTLQYAEDDESFGLPKNLYIIGTMNTADRSIALVDLALRRRFHFVEFHPDKPPIEGLLDRWLEKNAPPEMAWTADVMRRANTKLDDRQAAIGPSYFMKEDLDEEKVRLVWEHNVLPYVEEHLYGETDRLAEFELDKLRHQRASAAADAASQGPEAPGESDDAEQDEEAGDAEP